MEQGRVEEALSVQGFLTDGQVLEATGDTS
jgi:hypothetical protein